MRARFYSTCVHCRKVIRPGDRIVRNGRGGPYLHEKCHVKTLPLFKGKEVPYVVGWDREQRDSR